ncbi:hypothetical protein CLU79DRAFT_775644 [Phycomyces nitens]|nr:hypothetical protein CLU79DRAFT_775644 [Phycomyces nitens]
MRFATSALSKAIRATTVASPAARFAQRQTLGSVRGYSTQAPKKGGNGLVLLTLAGLGAAGGIYYNQNKATLKTSAPVKAVEKVKEVSEPAFNAKEFLSLKLESVEKINHNTSLFRFTLPKADQRAGLHVASCVITRYPITKKDGSPGYIIRPYTPTSPEEAEGHVDLIVKSYPDGKMSKHIHDLKIGDTLDIKGPIPKYNWDGSSIQNVGMIAGGTGITPMLQIIRKVFNDKSTDEKTKVTLVFANQTEEDILLKDELDKYAAQYPDRFKVVYVLDKPQKTWEGVKGFVTPDLIKEHLPTPETESSIVFVCGPDPMVAALAGPKAKDKSQGEVSGVLKALGYGSENVYKF